MLLFRVQNHLSVVAIRCRIESEADKIFFYTSYKSVKQRPGFDMIKSVSRAMFASRSPSTRRWYSSFSFCSSSSFILYENNVTLRLNKNYQKNTKNHPWAVNYKVWSVVQEQVYHTPILDVNDLKQHLLDVWAAVDKRIIYYFVNVHFGR